jgi:signal transduction histidine kinase/CheY-like chemotaxis protein
MPSSLKALPRWLANVISKQSDEEVARQAALLAAGAQQRSVLTFISFALATLFVPVWITIPLAVIEFASERKGLKLMQGLSPKRQPFRYLASLALILTSQLAYNLAMAFAFHSGEPMAQPYAAGSIALTLLQLASTRAVHLPCAMAGLFMSLLVTFGVVSYDYQSSMTFGALIASYLALATASYFIWTVLLENHRLHAGIAAERLASKAADRAKSRFLAQMSHELRTPLNAILGLGLAELGKAAPGTTRDRLTLITDSAEGLTVMLDDILDMAAIEAGRLAIRPVGCDLHKELRAAVALYHPLYEAKGLTLSLQLDPNLPAHASLDPKRLRQCLTNLFSNSLKYVETGGAVLMAARGPTGQLALNFRDTGPGLPASLRDRLFEPFQRGRDDGQGTGLGLSITHALARSMAGDLRLVPSPSGAEFALTLGVEWLDCDLEQPLEPTTAIQRPERFLVLVVDDIATNRLVARVHLELLGLRVIEAASGAEAVDLARQTEPDLVLMDMNMPEMNGLQAKDAICRSRLGGSKLPIIAMTADAAESHRQNYLRRGMDGFITKPLSPAALVAVLKQHLDDKKP